MTGNIHAADRETARMIRVDQAGEYGAARIYAGQLAVLGKGSESETIRHMAEKEREHLRDFDRVLVARRVRPTALSPVWHVAGFALGAATALMGPKAAMACTEAVEEVIVEHYARQETALGDGDPELRGLIAQARADETRHAATAIESGAREAPCHGPLTDAIRAGTRLAIWLSERV
jgi:ubiquinone biosynthesis monooxygenase Coq7